MSIFPNVPQDTRAIRNDETDFEHLSRRAGSNWDRVRSVIDEWCGYLDCSEREGVLGRLRSGQSGQFRAAFWELYLLAVFRKLGFTIDYQGCLYPDKLLTPDFHLGRGQTSVFVEATSIEEAPEIRMAQRRLGTLLEAINMDDRIGSSNFLLNYDPIRTSPKTPPLRSLCDQIAEWLSSLDPAHANHFALSRYEECCEEQGCMEWRHAGWHVRFFAIRRRFEARGLRLDSVISGPHPGEAWRKHDARNMKKAMERKEKKYGRECQPYVIAVMLTRSSWWHEVASALFGIAWEHPAMMRDERIAPGWSSDSSGERRDVSGFWLSENGPRHRNVSAVITALGLGPHETAKAELDLWLNPWADHPLDEAFPFRTQRVDLSTGAFIPPAEPQQPTRSILGLWEGWPMIESNEKKAEHSG